MLTRKRNDPERLLREPLFLWLSLHNPLKNAILLISILFWEALPVNAEPIRVLQIMPAMDAGGMETFVMNVYRTLDREQVQFDFL